MATEKLLAVAKIVDIAAYADDKNGIVTAGNSTAARAPKQILDIAFSFETFSSLQFALHNLKKFIWNDLLAHRKLFQKI